MGDSNQSGTMGEDDVVGEVIGEIQDVLLRKGIVKKKDIYKAKKEEKKVEQQMKKSQAVVRANSSDNVTSNVSSTENGFRISYKIDEKLAGIKAELEEWTKITGTKYLCQIRR